MTASTPEERSRIAAMGGSATKGTSRNNLNSRKTHCIHGHKFTPSNTYKSKGKRWCKTCTRERHKLWSRENTRRKHEQSKLAT